MVDNGKAKVKAVKKVFVLFIIVSALSGKTGILMSLCASFPFVIPVILGEGDDCRENLKKSIGFGIVGIATAVLLEFFVFKQVKAHWIFHSLCGALSALWYFFFGVRLSVKHRLTAKCIIILWVLLFAFV